MTPTPENNIGKAFQSGAIAASTDYDFSWRATDPSLYPVTIQGYTPITDESDAGLSNVVNEFKYKSGFGKERAWYWTSSNINRGGAEFSSATSTKLASVF